MDEDRCRSFRRTVFHGDSAEKYKCCLNKRPDFNQQQIKMLALLINPIFPSIAFFVHQIDFVVCYMLICMLYHKR